MRLWRPPRVFVVVDLGFGDAGKGLLTDFLVRRTGASLVVRYNGGAQAGHNVVTEDGRHHAFAQIGAGSFVPGVRTFLSRHMVVHPTALLVEAAVLGSQGVEDVLSRIRISERARVITPFHQAANRLRELSRGAARHGSCGVGVGEAVRDSLEHPEETVVAGDLREAAVLRGKLRRIRERKHGELRALWGAGGAGLAMERERSVFEREDVLEAWVEQATRVAALGLVVPDATLARWMAESSAVVFEGAQGVLLDEWWGFHPHTTWSCCTAANALELVTESGGAEVMRVGVLRSYAVRHGAGPLPTETETMGPGTTEHNVLNEWQGPVRYGWFDAVLARYALNVMGGVDVLAMTHLDAPRVRHPWLLCSGYRGEADAELIAHRSGTGVITRLGVSSSRSLEWQARLAELLSSAKPVLESCEPEEGGIVSLVERLLGRSVDIISRGPRASDVRLLAEHLFGRAVL
jgi:adenylosuccinate synthase